MEKVELKYPVTVAGVKVSELSMRRPTVGDMIAAEKTAGNQAEGEARLFGNLCEVSPETIKALDWGDYRALQKVFGGFFD